MPSEPLRIKVLFIVAFLGAFAVVFLASEPLADWVKSSKSDWLSMFAVQAVFALPFALLIFALEAKVIWKAIRQDVFSTIHPISIGAFAGYVAHFALR
jgi:hypothetical protein